MNTTQQIDRDAAIAAPHRIDALIAALFDDESFLPLGGVPAEPGGKTETPLAGVGQVHGKSVAFAAAPAHTGTQRRAFVGILDQAQRTGCPLVLVSNFPSGNKSSAVMPAPMTGIARLVELSGLVPIVAIEIGEGSTSGELVSALADFRVQIAPKDGRNSSYTADHIEDGAAWVRDLLDVLPRNNCEFAAPTEQDGPDPSSTLCGIVPDNPAEPYDVMQVVSALSSNAPVVINGEGPALITAFVTIGGLTVSVVANQPAHRGGLLGPDEALKASRFIRFCDAFNLPLLFLIDTPGPSEPRTLDYAPYAQLAHATAAASVPIASVLLRRAHGLPTNVFGAKALGADVVLAWPSATLAPAGLHRLVSADQPKEIDDTSRADALEQFRRTAADMDRALTDGLIDQVVTPDETPWLLARWFQTLESKRKQGPAKKHGNFPL